MVFATVIATAVATVIAVVIGVDVGIGAKGLFCPRRGRGRGRARESAVVVVVAAQERSRKGEKKVEQKEKKQSKSKRKARQKKRKKMGKKRGGCGRSAAASDVGEKSKTGQIVRVKEGGLRRGWEREREAGYGKQAMGSGRWESNAAETRQMGAARD